jgi:hypothetical protein
MSLFSSRIDPYASFTINLGPLYVERVFDSLLTREGVRDVNKMGAVERFERYLVYLRCQANAASKRHYPVMQFYRGHFYLQLANHSKSQEFIYHYREKALCHYQIYLELGPQPDESWYYAQWQTGILQEVLHYPWVEAEESLIRASGIDKLRGEADKRLIEHYIRCREWKTAYRISTRAIERFLDKNPVAQRRWFVDFDAYNWHLLRLHRMIGYKLGLRPEQQHEKQHTDGTVIPQAAAKQAEL